MNSTSNPTLPQYPSPEATPDEVLGFFPLIPHPHPSPYVSPYTTDYDEKGVADLQPHSLAAKVSTIKVAPSKIVAPTPIYASWRNTLLTDSFVTDSLLPHSIVDHQRSPTLGFDVADLPVEIICQIFAKFVENDSRQNDDDLPRRLVSRRFPSDPIRMGQICSRWAHDSSQSTGIMVKNLHP